MWVQRFVSTFKDMEEASLSNPDSIGIMEITSPNRGWEQTKFYNGFSVLIPTWNNLPYLKLCVESIRQHSVFNHQIIIHVNEGTDGTLEWVEKEGLDYTYIIINPTLDGNRGWTMEQKVKGEKFSYYNR